MQQNIKAPPKKRFKIPTAFSIIGLIMVFFIVMSWILYAAGAKTMIWNGKTFESTNLQGLGILDILPAIWHGFVSKAEIIAFILCVGGILALMTKTKAIDAGISNVVKKLNGKEVIIIPILMIIFGLGGTSYGMWEETVAFFPILIPVFKKAGFGSITAVLVILLGAGTGNLASTINPFATGIAFTSAQDVVQGAVKDATTQSIMFGTRWIVFFLLEPLAIAYVVWLGLRIKNKKTIIAGVDEAAIDRDFIKNDGEIEFNWKRKITLIIFILGFVFMILSYLPWSDWLDPKTLSESNANYNKTMFWLASTHGQWAKWGEWYLISVSGVFLMIGFIVFLLNLGDFKTKGETREETFVNTFVDGSKDVLSVCLLIAVAAGLGIILEQSHIGPWIANSAAGIKDAGLIGFAVIIFMLSLVLAFLLPSTSGFAAAFIPIFVSIAHQAFAPGQSPDAAQIKTYQSAVGLIIFAFLFAEGIVNLCSPTSAALMAYTKLSHVPFNVWIKHTWKYTLALTAISFILMIIFGAIASSNIVII